MLDEILLLGGIVLLAQWSNGHIINCGYGPSHHPVQGPGSKQWIFKIPGTIFKST